MRIFKSLLLGLIIIMVTACGTSRHGVRGNRGYKPPKLQSEWSRLDIKLSGSDNKKLYREVKSWLGTPYRAGGTTKDGSDCSGFVMTVYKKVYGISLQRNSQLMFDRNCREIDRDDLREGDLVFFNNARGGRINHVGIYLKENKFAHTSSSQGVIISDLDERYYATHFFAAGRVRR